jgi:hypothetical protein
MPTPDPFYWRTFNVLLRLLGLGATFAGAVVLVTFGLGIPAPPGVEPRLSVGAIVTGGILALAGLGFLMLPPYRPDLGDVGALVNPLRQREGRSWWTGERRSR